MRIEGKMLIGHETVLRTNGSIRAIHAATEEVIEPPFGGAADADLECACALAWSAFDTYRESSLPARADFLEAIAQNILDLGDGLIERCVAESGLPRARVESERGRTVGQLTGNAGAGKGPQFKTSATRSEGPGDWATFYEQDVVKAFHELTGESSVEPPSAPLCESA
ncbi:acyl-CoA reductase-like NAD-dependent aldehyde dehydrogenase [Paraburkholderia sp. UCT70]